MFVRGVCELIFFVMVGGGTEGGVLTFVLAGEFDAKVEDYVVVVAGAST